MRLCFDIETNGFLDTVTKCHALVIEDLDTGDMWSHHGDYQSSTCEDGSIEVGLKKLEQAEVLGGHNVLTFDLPVLKKLYPWFNPRGKVVDTLTCSRLIWADIEQSDFRAPAANFPAKLIGSHSLKAWGYRLGELKGEYHETADWKEWSPQLQAYCEQDVKVTVKLWKLVESKGYSQEAIELEHDFQRVIHQQELHGFRFDTPKAAALFSKLVKRQEELTKELQNLVPPTITPMKTPEYYVGWVGSGSEIHFRTKGAAKKAKAREIVPGPLRKKIEPFNPGSRTQISKFLISKGWVPEKFTPTGQPEINETTLEGTEFPEAKPLLEYLMIAKRIGQVATGDNAWLKLEKQGRIYGRVITGGCVTGRCSHLNPNLGQVPKADKKTPYGYECRDLFIADEGQVLLGWDASGLELRCLGHYIAKYDGGVYAKVVVEGDVHSLNQKLIGLDTRDDAKTFVYADIYGAGDLKRGKIAGFKPGDIEKAKQYRSRWFRAAKMLAKKGIKDERSIALSVKGGVLKQRFLNNLPALKQLREDIQKAVKERGYLFGLDGRKLHIRSLHSVLNTLLQSAGAILVKKATVLFVQKVCKLFEPTLNWLDALPRIYGKQWSMVVHVHDEAQNSVMEQWAETIGKLAVEAIREAGEYFKFRCPLTGEYKVGRSWAETH